MEFLLAISFLGPFSSSDLIDYLAPCQPQNIAESYTMIEMGIKLLVGKQRTGRVNSREMQLKLAAESVKDRNYEWLNMINKNTNQNLLKEIEIYFPFGKP
jgi:hypothetical protein